MTQMGIDTWCYVPRSALRLSEGLLRREGNEVCRTKHWTRHTDCTLLNY